MTADEAKKAYYAEAPRYIQRNRIRENFRAYISETKRTAAQA